MFDSEHLSVHYRKKALPLRWVRRIVQKPQQSIYAHFASCFPPDSQKRILDLGVSGSLDDPKLYFFEYYYPFKTQIVACGLEESDLFKCCYPQVEYIQLTRQEKLPFDPQSFDVVFCNAVIEHVGHRDIQRAFLADILRVGRSVFLTTPNRWYPVELHTLLPLVHYLPTPIYRNIFNRLGFHFFSREENLNLLDKRSLWDLVPESFRSKATIRTLKFLGLPSNFMLIVNE